MSTFVTSAIDEAFRAHGLVSRALNGFVQVENTLRICASTRVSSEAIGRVQIQLNVVTEAVALGGSNPIVDRFAGIGETGNDAEKDAFSKFLIGSFHVLAESLTSHKCDSGQVEWEDWRARSTSWRVCSGPLLTQATVECKTKTQYGGVLSKIQEQFLSQAGPGPHWLRVFAGFLDGHLSASEAILDGEEWNEGQSILRQAAWMPSMGYESLRHLIVILPAAIQSGKTLPAEAAPREGWFKRWILRRE